MIKGNLSSFSLGEIFQSLAVNTHTGTLKIVEKSGEEKYIYFSKGEISLFSIRSHPTLRIGEILIRQGKIVKPELDKALELQKESGELLGKILMKTCGLKQEDLQHALETKISEEIYDLFLTNDAEFEFYVNHFPEEIFDTFQLNLRISLSTYSVLMEGVRRADEWRVIQKKIQSFNEIYTLTSAPSGIEPQNPQDALLLELVDGKTSVRRVFDKYPGSRFDCCKMLFEFLEAGRIRPLTLDECRSGGSQSKQKKDFDRSIDFLRFAVELSPNRPEPMTLLGNSLRELGRENEGLDFLMRATQLYFQSGQFPETTEHGSQLIIHFPQNESLLGMVFQAALESNKPNLVQSSGEKLADLYSSKGALVRAAEVIDKISQLFPKDVNLKLRAAGLLKEAGDVAGAIARYEEAAATASTNARIGEKIKILRLLFELAPDRQDIKQEVSNLLSLQEKLEYRKKRRVTIAGVCIILLLISLLIPVLYEIKARELISHAWRLEQISLNSGEFSSAKSAYERVLDTYGFSLQAKQSRLALERIATFEHLKEEKVRLERREQESRQEEKLKRVRDSFAQLTEEAKKLENQGDFQGAFNIFNRLGEDFPDIPKAQAILFPLVITSNPKECLVQLNGANLGTTPVVLHRKKGETVNVQLSRTGCQSTQRSAVVGSSWQLHIDMDLRPLTEFKLSGPIHQPADIRDGELFFPSRDGYFYAVRIETQSILWQRQIGRFGDVPSNPVYTEGEILLGNAAGEIAAISRKTGKSRWRFNVGAPISATPAISADAQWAAAGDLDGKVTLIQNQEGKNTAAFTTENEILCSPLFWRGFLIVASEDNQLYFLSIPDLKPVFAESLASELDADPVPRGNWIYCVSRNGSLFRYNLADRRFDWTFSAGERVSSQPLIVDDSIIIGTRGGKAIAVNLETGKPEWSLAVSNSALGDFSAGGNELFLGTAAGEILAIHRLKHSIEWRFRSDDSISEGPRSWKNHLYAATSSGKFFVMEIFK